MISPLQTIMLSLFFGRDLVIKNHSGQVVPEKEFLKAPIDTLFHCAAAHPSISKSETEIFEGNVIFSQKILDLAEKVRAKVFVFCSTMSVFGKHRAGTLRINSEIIDPSVYGRSKKTVENSLIKWANNKTCKYHIVRLPGIVGPGAHQTFLSDLAHCLLNNNKMELHHQDSLYNHGVHINDLCDFLFSLSKKTNCSTICQLGCDSPLKLNTVVELLSYTLEKSPHNIHFSELLSGPIDISNAIELGYKSHSTETLIKKFLNLQFLKC